MRHMNPERRMVNLLIEEWNSDNCSAEGLEDAQSRNNLGSSLVSNTAGVRNTSFRHNIHSPLSRSIPPLCLSGYKGSAMRIKKPRARNMGRRQRGIWHLCSHTALIDMSLIYRVENNLPAEEALPGVLEMGRLTPLTPVCSPSGAALIWMLLTP